MREWELYNVMKPLREGDEENTVGGTKEVEIYVRSSFWGFGSFCKQCYPCIRPNRFTEAKFFDPSSTNIYCELCFVLWAWYTEFGPEKSCDYSYHVCVILKTPHKSVLIFNVNYDNLLTKRWMVLYEKKVADYVKQKKNKRNGIQEFSWVATILWLFFWGLIIYGPGPFALRESEGPSQGELRPKLYNTEHQSMSWCSRGQLSPRQIQNPTRRRRVELV